MAVIVHVFQETGMAYAHKSLAEIASQAPATKNLGKDDVVVFVNKSWTACKILSADGQKLLYYRAPGGKEMSLEELRYLPTTFGGSKFSFKGNSEAKMIRGFENFFKKRDATLKAVAHA